MRRVSRFVLMGALGALSASPLQGQALPAVFDALRQGGSWIQIPILQGRGTLTTPSLPSGGLVLEGCMEIWNGHSGSWTLRVRDTYGNGRLEAQAGPSQDIPFRYDPGPLAQLEVDVRWSEPRDTTLFVWVGLASPRAARDPCEPVYSGGN